MDNNVNKLNTNNSINNNNQSSAITLGDIVRVIKKNWILMAIVTVIVFALGAIYTFGIKKPTYKSTVTLKVEVPLTSETSADVSNALNAATKYAQSVAQYVKLDAVLEPVCKKHSDIISLTSLKKETTTSFSNSSIFVGITVEDVNGKNAEVLAQSIAEEVVKYSKDSTDTSVDAKNKMLCTISVADKATANVYASPNKTLYLIVSALAGIVLALVIVFLKEFASSKFKTTDEIESLGLPVLNTLPDNKLKNKEAEETLLEPSVKNFEPYNRLMSNIKFANVDNPYKVIMFTSSIMDELKTTVSSNFAYTLSHNEKKVIILDLDTRKPSVHKYFNISKEKGIVEYLDGSITLEELIKHTNVNVDVITVGKNVVNPITLLESEKLKDLVNKLKEQYDYVVVDTPPLMACNDATIISKLCDGVVFNIAINQGKKKEIKASLNQLIENNANVIGINITKASIKDKGGYYYYYYYDYGDKK